jgi:hypothetical protein
VCLCLEGGGGRGGEGEEKKGERLLSLPRG